MESLLKMALFIHSQVLIVGGRGGGGKLYFSEILHDPKEIQVEKSVINENVI